MNALEWLERKVPAFKNLGDADRREIMEFSLLWAFFEFSLLEKHATADKLRQLSEKLDADKRIEPDRIEEAVGF